MAASFLNVLKDKKLKYLKMPLVAVILMYKLHIHYVMFLQQKFIHSFFLEGFTVFPQRD